MRKKTLTSGNVSGILLGLIGVSIGTVIFLAVPGIGWIIGGALVLVGLLSGGKRRKVWRCRQCAAVVDRG